MRKKCDLSRSSPASQKWIAHVQKASIITSHITWVAEMRKTGVKSVSKATVAGLWQSRRASAKVPSTAATAGSNARCIANSLKPATKPTTAM